MLNNTYRYVEYLDDGHELFQCLECYGYVPAIGSYCMHCGCKHTTKLDCRSRSISRHEFENPHIDFYRQHKYRTQWKSDFYSYGYNRKDVIRLSQKEYLRNEKSLIWNYGNQRYEYKPCSKVLSIVQTNKENFKKYLESEIDEYNPIECI
jgi:hypothetical protein